MITNRDIILETAKLLIYKNGYEKTSVDQIITECSVSKSNFYYHFKSKEELGLHVLETWIAQYRSDILNDTLCNIRLNPSRRIKTLYEKQKSSLREFENMFGCPLGNLATELSSSKESFRNIISSFFNEWQSQIEGCIQDGIQNGEFRRDISAKLVSELILSHLEGALMLGKTHRSFEHLTLGVWTILELLKPVRGRL